MKSNFFGSKPRLDKVLLQWDPELPGFGVRFNCNGTVCYIAKLSTKGKDRTYTLGPIEDINRNDARKLVRQMKLVARGGGDPRTILEEFLKSAGAIDKACGITFGELFPIYIERYAKLHKSSWLKDYQRIQRYLYPVWKDRLLSEICREDFLRIFEKIGRHDKHPTAANRLKETLATMWKQAQIFGYLPMGASSPTFGIKKFSEFPREERLEANQVGQLLNALYEHPDRQFADAIELILHTGLRHGTCIKLRWDWIDFERQTLTIPRPETKNRKGHVLALNPIVIQILNRQRRFANNPFVFSSRFTRSHITSLQKHWELIRQEAKLPNLHIHDLRRSVGCFLLERTGSLRFVGNVLNQTNEHVTAIYGFYNQEQTRPVLQAYSEFIESQKERGAL